MLIISLLYTDWLAYRDDGEPNYYNVSCISFTPQLRVARSILDPLRKYRAAELDGSIGSYF